MLMSIRYAFRNPARWRRPPHQLYNRILDQIEWAEQVGFDRVALAEHHVSDDNFLPSLLPIATAIAARTKRMLIGTEIFLLPLHHPVRLAEDVAVLDIVSGGRFEWGVAAGYREAEYGAMGMKLSQRPGRMEEGIEIIRKCWTEEAFSYDGKYYQLHDVRMTPKPITPGGPKLILGAASPAAARRAARLGDDMLPTDPALWDVYHEEREKLGRPVPRRTFPAWHPNSLHVTEDPERDWEILREHARFDMAQYAKWGLTGVSSFGDMALTDETLRMASTVWTPEQMLEHCLAWQRDFPHWTFCFYPLWPGMDPEMAQSSLELIAGKVLPELHKARAAAGQ